ncbi:MAG: serine hydrolase [Chitinophagaceae bacterium]|nr:serine hydrolase [Chitinophagaceae bacterium]
MKKWKWIIISLVALEAIVFCITTITGNNYLYKAILYNYVDIDDYKLFSNRTVKAGMPQPWPLSRNYNTIKPSKALQRELDSIKSVAFVVIRNDSICFEEYWEGYNDHSLSNSFSCSKSIIGILTGIALDDGSIKSLDDPIGNYIKDFKDPKMNVITIRELLMMSSNSDWDESYSGLMSQTTKGYYGTDLYGQVTSLKLKGSPGKDYRYRSGDTQLLSLVLKAATGKSMSEYASEKLWKPMGAEHDALWSLDHEGGIEKAYCCFNTNARDFARIGDLYLHEGNWRGKQLVPAAYVKQSLLPVGLPDETGAATNYYGYQWWLMPERGNIFYARGLNGQWIICIPDKHMVIVRLGHQRGPKMLNAYQEVYDMVDWAVADL